MLSVKTASSVHFYQTLRLFNKITPFFRIFNVKNFEIKKNTHGQISTKELPVSFGIQNLSTKSVLPAANKILPALNMSEIRMEDERDEVAGLPPRFGYPTPVNCNLNNSGEWTKLSNGDRIWRLNIECEKALSINLLYDKFWLPEGAKLFVYSQDKTKHIGAFTSVNNKGTEKEVRGFATGLIYSDKITLEYYVPNGVEQGIISIAYVVQGYRYINIAKSTESLGSSGACQVNVNCTEGQNWQNEKNAVALILVNGIRWCSGSLVNTTANDARPLFLTANHCLGGWANAVVHDAIDAPNLDLWSFYWNYEHPTCANSNVEPAIKSTSGAIVVANDSISDFALLQLTENPSNRNDVNLYYLGWDGSGNAGTGGVGIHHPNGDVKKIATHNVTPTSNGNYWNLYWMQTQNGYSVTEGGSSGSPLLNNSHRVIGQLYGGSYINCSNPSNDLAMYGKFSVSWIGNGAPDNRRKLQPWLDPDSTGILVLNGCSGIVNFTNQTVTSDTTIVSCGDLNVQNITLTNGATLTLNAGNDINIKEVYLLNGAKLILNAGGEATIERDFDMELGTELEIN